MELDARRFTDGTILDTDVCIVGAGPAGLVLSAELVDAQCDVIVLESGGAPSGPEILALNDGDLSGDVYAGLGATRHRGVGGTSLLWNSAANGEAAAKFAPLDASDFEERPDRDHSGWPFGFAELREHYVRAQRICGLGPFSYDAAAWTTPLEVPWSELGPSLVSRVYQFGTREALVTPLRASIRRATNVRLCTHATATALQVDTGGRRIGGIAVATPGGPRWTVRAKRVVLAAGAVENARLLLLMENGSAVPVNASGWVGRGFMEHPRDRTLSLRPRQPESYARSSFYDQRRAVDDSWVVGRIALTDAALASGALLNASGTLIPRLSALSRRLRAVLPAFAGRWLPGEGHGWSTRRRAAREFDGFTVLLNVEQSPHPENRVTLGARRDSLGIPLPSLHWQWRADDQKRLERLRALFARELAVIGEVTIGDSDLPDPNAHHHAGTTRMHDDPAHGVTDRHGRVHATDNLYVAGASVFPTAGFANPVLTIVALALRLARQLMSDR
jgi:choline dehydrogenase-like flavoprotein